MIYIEYALIFGLLLAALLGAMAQMNRALDEIDLERFFLWTCIASVISGIPTLFW